MDLRRYLNIPTWSLSSHVSPPRPMTCGSCLDMATAVITDRTLWTHSGHLMFVFPSLSPLLQDNIAQRCRLSVRSPSQGPGWWPQGVYPLSWLTLTQAPLQHCSRDSGVHRAWLVWVSGLSSQGARPALLSSPLPHEHFPKSQAHEVRKRFLHPDWPGAYLMLGSPLGAGGRAENKTSKDPT